MQNTGGMERGKAGARVSCNLRYTSDIHRVFMEHGFERATGREFERQENVVVSLALIDYREQVWMAYLRGCSGFMSDSAPKCGICSHSLAK